MCICTNALHGASLIVLILQHILPLLSLLMVLWESKHFLFGGKLIYLYHCLCNDCGYELEIFGWSLYTPTKVVLTIFISFTLYFSAIYFVSHEFFIFPQLQFAGFNKTCGNRYSCSDFGMREAVKTGDMWLYVYECDKCLRYYALSSLMDFAFRYIPFCIVVCCMLCLK